MVVFFKNVIYVCLLFLYYLFNAYEKTKDWCEMTYVDNPKKWNVLFTCKFICDAHCDCIVYVVYDWWLTRVPHQYEILMIGSDTTHDMNHLWLTWIPSWYINSLCVDSMKESSLISCNLMVTC